VISRPRTLTICLINGFSSVFDDTKLVGIFGDLVIDKRLVRQIDVRGSRTIPSFVEEWLVTRFGGEGRSTEETKRQILDFVHKHLPAKTDKQVFLNRLHEGDQVTILDIFSARVELQKDQKVILVPSLNESKVSVSSSVIDQNPDLLRGGLWGAGKLFYAKDDKALMLIDFKPMQSGRVSLPKLSEARKQFSTSEWIEVIIRTMGLEPSAYSEGQRRRLILRLLPLIQTNINMIELAPKGTGKSFVFSNLSRYVWVNSGGALTQAQLFFNQNTRETGLLGGRYDLLVLDEGQSIDFQGADNIHAKFKDYLESGKYTIGANQVASECGLMVLANIELLNGKPRREDYIRELPDMFHDSALLDRFHGIIPGWEIPRFETHFAANGFGFKADVFGEYVHQLRHASPHEFTYGGIPAFSGDIRDVNAVKKMAGALAKLLMLMPEDADFDEFVLSPALDLRQRVRSQLAAVDPFEFSSTLNVTRQ
jgi:ATP-dependent Lon protease